MTLPVIRNVPEHERCISIARWHLQHKDHQSLPRLSFKIQYTLATMQYLNLAASVLLAATASGSALPELAKRQAPPAFAAGGETTLAQRAAFLCPASIDATLPLNNTFEFGLRFCSNVDRWSPNDLFSSQQLLNLGSRNYREAAAQCAPRCASFAQCETFSITAVGTPTNGSFNCNLYNRTTIFRANTTGGLFYARQRNQTQPRFVSTVLLTQTVCPTPAPPAATTTTTAIRTVTNPTATITQFPVVVVIGGQTITATAPGQTVTRTSSVNGGTVASAAPINVFIGQTGPIQVTQIINNVVTVVVVVVNGDINRPTTTSTVAAPSATNTFSCPADRINEFQSTRRPATQFTLNFCSNTQRWAADTLISTSPVENSNYTGAARECSLRCDANTACMAFSVAPNAAGSTTFNCNQYDVIRVGNGVTQGGLFYARAETRAAQAGGDPQCVGAVTPVAAGMTTYRREFCEQATRYSPEDLFNSAVVTGRRVGGSEPIVAAVNTCATQCTSFGTRCRTFSVTFNAANPAVVQGDLPIDVRFNCNLYQNSAATGDVRVVALNTQGGAFYRNDAIRSNSTMAVRRFAH